MLIHGYWFPANSSARFRAELHAQQKTYSLISSAYNTSVQDLAGLAFSQRVGNIPRKITFPDGSVFETTDNDSIDALLELSRHKDSQSHFLHLLETRWRWILSALVLSAIMSLVMVVWGFPWASKVVAHAIPKEINRQISDATLKTLDDLLLQESGLSKSSQLEIRQHFNQVLLAGLPSEPTYELYFRRMRGTANAFALPSGVIVITDRLVEIAGSQDEIDAVLLHEIAHVQHQHGMQRVVHGSILVAAVTILTGDPTAVSEWVVAFPVFLMQNSYSRKHESEADTYAFEKMLELGIDPIAFANIMQRIEDESGAPSKDKEKDKNENWQEYLSTHPRTSNRILKAKQASQRFRAAKH